MTKYNHFKINSSVKFKDKYRHLQKKYGAGIIQDVDDRGGITVAWSNGEVLTWGHSLLEVTDSWYKKE